MKQNFIKIELFRVVVFLLILFSTILIYSQENNEKTKIYTLINKDSTQIEIELLPNERVLFRETPNEKIKPRKDFKSKTDNGKRICGLQFYVIHQSYGKYKIKNDSIYLTFIDENPIEKVEIKVSEKKNNKKETVITVNKNESTYDLEVYQNGKEVLNIIPFLESEKAKLDNIDKPVVIKYRENNRKIKLNSKNDTEITVTINDLKSFNHIRNTMLIYCIKDITLK